MRIQLKCKEMPNMAQYTFMYKYAHAEKMIITNEELYMFLEKKE